MGELLSLMRRRGSFSPLNVSGLVLWLDAADSDTLTLGAGGVAQWDDKSGLNNHVVQGVTGQQPNLVSPGQNGLDSVDYSTVAGDVLIASDDVSLQNVFDGGGYVVMAFEPDTQNAADVAMLLSKNVWMLWYTDTSGGASDIALTHNFSGNDGKWSSVSRVLAHDAPYILELRYDSGSVSNDPVITLNGSVVTLGEDTTPTGTRDTDVGNNLGVGGRYDASTARSIDGEVFELLVYDMIPSAAQRAQIRGYLASKWGIGV